MTVDVDLDQHRSALVGHCYRMLGSVVDADDAVQETMLRAFRNLDRFEGRAALRTWLYRIATNVCLDALSERKRRERPMDFGPAGSVDAPLIEHPRTHWLEPIPDAVAISADGDPEGIALQREKIRLAFVAALQHIPPKQRAALLLTEVLGWSAAETAECLDTTVASVNSALQRARATLASRDLSGASAPLDESQEELLAQFVDAFERYDVDGVVRLLREDVTMSMPPYSLWLRGRDSIRGWLLGRGSVCRGSRLVRTAANGMPAFAHYHSDGSGGPWEPWAIIVFEMGSDGIAAWNAFLDTETLFPRFGMPAELE
ncbi:MAG: sigma-70 family RNA polymerase sigma factor [Thermoanaerobaculia bacterium]